MIPRKSKQQVKFIAVLGLGSLLPAADTAHMQALTVTIKRLTQLRGGAVEAAYAPVTLPAQTAVMRLADWQGQSVRARTVKRTQG